MPKRKIVNSNLVYSPAQVTEHRRVELRDQDVPKETKQEFEKLKEDFPEVFSLNNQDIGHTQLVTMHVNTGDSPPICQKPYTLPLKHYSWAQQEIETLERAGIIKKSLSPCFSEISRPLAKLTAKDTQFEWTPQCQFSFEMLKEALMSAPILKYPDTDKPYTIFTDASKYGWAGVLTQEHTSVIDGKQVTTNHPVAYVSGMFRGSQLNWAAMTKEAYAIYMTVKKSTFYLTGADITLRSDHLPLNKFLQKNTLNLHVNNWAVEIESFKIKFVHIAGRDNVIADTLSCLIDIDPDII